MTAQAPTPRRPSAGDAGRGMGMEAWPTYRDAFTQVDFPPAKPSSGVQPTASRYRFAFPRILRLPPGRSPSNPAPLDSELPRIPRKPSRPWPHSNPQTPCRVSPTGDPWDRPGSADLDWPSSGGGWARSPSAPTSKAKLGFLTRPLQKRGPSSGRSASPGPSQPPTPGPGAERGRRSPSPGCRAAVPAAVTPGPGVADRDRHRSPVCPDVVPVQPSNLRCNELQASPRPSPSYAVSGPYGPRVPEAEEEEGEADQMAP